ncbi:hypothetical protein V0288_04440 [Pannus brasiliensis CCIBt3594]|uniref:Uncharacterized protein n=1 Tax=Pannus brasiliensis CCIBt3594 TaxID=1427578 RepID=A0AAW9QMH5_9CHRO
MREKEKSLQEIEGWLERSLQEEFPSIVPLKVHCAVRDHTFFISVHVIESSDLSPSIVLPVVEKKVMAGAISPDYLLETYFIVHEKDRFDSLYTSAIVPLVPASLALRKNRFFSLSPRFFGFLVGAIASIIAIYAFTRPCLRGTCPELERARVLGDRAVASIESDAKAARDDISSSLAILGDIPPWSSYHGTAVSLRDDYQQRARDLDRAIAILNRASKAVDGSRDKLLPLSRWREIRQLWRDNLGALAKISPESSLYPFANRKIAEYQKNLAEVDRRIVREQQAEQSLQNARESAEIAMTREKTAQSLGDRQFVEKAWRSAIDRLRAIPPDTGVAGEARRLEGTYLTRWTTARAERDREARALDRWNRAGDRVKKAENAALQQKWTDSAKYWQESLAILQEIPRESPEYPRASASITRYQQALEQVRSYERISKDLQQVCTKVVNICTYELGDKRIRVYLNESYARQIQTTALQAQARTDFKTQLDLMNHLSSIESAFQTISDSAARTVEVYNVDRVLLSVYEPRR